MSDNTFLDQLKVAFDCDSVAQKNIWLRRAHDEIARLSVKKVVINEVHTSHHCEDCGHFSDCTVTVTIDDKPPIQIYSDGHLGGGDFDDNSASGSIGAVFKKMFPFAHVEITPTTCD